jgi:hypothetical protein
LCCIIHKRTRITNVNNDYDLLIDLKGQKKIKIIHDKYGKFK